MFCEDCCAPCYNAVDDGHTTGLSMETPLALTRDVVISSFAYVLGDFPFRSILRVDQVASRLSDMRLEYVEPESPVTEAIRQRRGGEINELDRTLLHSLPIAAGWNTLLGAVRTQTSLPATQRELAICRVAALNLAWFEWKHHYPLALQAGVNDTLLQLVKKGREWDTHNCESQVETVEFRILLRYTDYMTVDIKVPDELFEVMKGMWSEKEILELTMVIASYNMVSRVLVALDVGEMSKTEL